MQIADAPAGAPAKKPRKSFAQQLAEIKEKQEKTSPLVYAAAVFGFPLGLYIIPTHALPSVSWIIILGLPLEVFSPIEGDQRSTSSAGPLESDQYRAQIRASPMSKFRGRATNSSGLPQPYSR